MKNILKKIGVFGIIIAMIIPFVELPIVNAEGENCSIHLQNYLFLDVDSVGYYEDGYSTYANFAYTFPRNNGNITILDVKGNLVTSDKQLATYDGLYSLAMSANTSGYYSKGSTKDAEGKIFVSGSSYDFADATTLIHASWGKYDENGKELTISEWNNYATDLNKGIFQNEIVLLGESISSNNVKIGGAELTAGSSGNVFKDLSKYPSTSTYNELKKYFQDLVDDDTTSSIQLKITRSFDFDDIKFGYQTGDGVYSLNLARELTQM